MSTLTSNQKEARADKQIEAAAAELPAATLHICGFSCTAFSPVEWMTPLYIDDPKSFKLSDKSLAQV